MILIGFFDRFLKDTLSVESNERTQWTYGASIIFFSRNIEWKMIMKAWADRLL